MKIKDSVVSIFLIFIIIVLVAIIGIFGYVVYTQIMGGGNIQINFGGEAGYPTIEFNNSSDTVDEEEPVTILQPVENVSNSDETNRYRHLYNQLEDDAKIIYTKLYENIENLKTGTYTIEFGNTFSNTLSKENGDTELKKNYQSAIEAFLYENPEVFYLDATKMYLNIEEITRITGVKYNVYINQGHKTNYLANGIFSKEDVEKCEAEIEQVKNEILAMIEGKSNYEKIKIIHDYLIDTIEYDTTLLEDNIYNIYGALVSKKCVCEGYAKAFQYLMNQIGIDNVIAIGTAINSNNQTENHAWNYVNLDGSWYAIDVTWDDPVIIGGGKLSQKTRYQYFLKGSNTLFRNHLESSTFTEGGQEFRYPTLNIYDYE